MKLRAFNPYLSLITALAALIVVPSASAAPYNWTGATTGTWNTGGNWSGSTVPLIADDLTILGPSNVAGALTINFNADNSARSIDFTNTSATSITNTTSGSNRTLTLGSGGITTGAGAVTIGSATANQAVNIALSTSQAWNIGAGGMTVNNVISGTGFGLTKTGTGLLVLKGTNSFSGGLTIKAGTVSSDNLGSGGNFLGAGTVTLGDTANTGAAATLNFNGSNFASSNAISVVGNGVSTLSVNGWNQTLNGNVTLSNNLTAITNNAFGSSMTFGGAFSGTGNLIIQSNAINNLNTSSTLTFGGLGGINMTGTITNSGSGSSSGSGNINTTISALIGTNVTGIIQNSTNSQLLLTNANSTYTSNITITAGTLSANTSKTGANPTSSVLGNTQTAGRTVTIASAGTLNFGATDIMGNGGSSPLLTIIANGGTIRNTSSQFNVLGPLQLNGGTLSSFGGVGADFPSFALTGGVTVGGSALSTIATNGSANSQIGIQTGGTTFNVADAVSGSANDLNVTGVLANWGGGANSGFLIKSGAGTMTLTGVNTYTGGTRIDGGTLALANTGNNALVNTGAVNVNGGTLALGTFSETVGAVTLTSGSITGSTGVLTGSSYAVQSGSVSAILGGVGIALTKTTTGAVTLSSVNSYTGATIVQAGKLTVNSTGNINTTSGVTIGTASTAAAAEFNFNSSTALTKTVTFATGSTGGVLSGSGTINSAITIPTGNTLSIGNSIGQMNFGNALTLAGTALMEIDGTAGAGLTGGNDFANVTSALTYGGAMTLDIGAVFGVGNYTWNLFDFAGADLGTFSTIALADQYSGSLLDGDGNGIWDLTSGSNTWQFTESSGVLGLTVVPEPSAALLGGLGLLLLLRRRRN